MYSLLISLAALILGYIFYGTFVAKVFGADAARKTPAYTKQDGMDYTPMPTWKVFMVQLLNIAGTGPIFGAIAGAMFGPSAYLWIVFGCIFAGSVHDYLSGMLSLRHGGVNLPDLVGRYLGKTTRRFMLEFSVLMLILVGAVFVYSPALILGDMFNGGILSNKMFWVYVVLIYYIIATLVPIDKIIGKVYPIFAVAIIFMALSLLVVLLIKWPSQTPELWDGLQNRAPGKGAIFPALFITIACGAISGFHATQSPLMARCLKNEKLGQPIFYGAMITEGIIALIWATISSYFFYGGGAAEMGAVDAAGNITTTAAPAIVTLVSKKWLGLFGSILALLGVVAAPITSGDTAMRSCRLIVADALKLDQKPIRNRLTVSIPLFIACGALLWFDIDKPDGFDIIWRYFGWANQTLAVFTLWAITAFLTRYRKGYYYMMTLLPACFMTSVCTTFIITAKIGVNGILSKFDWTIPDAATPYIGLAIFVICLALYYQWYFGAKPKRGVDVFAMDAYNK